MREILFGIDDLCRKSEVIKMHMRLKPAALEEAKDVCKKGYFEIFTY